MEAGHLEQTTSPAFHSRAHSVQVRIEDEEMKTVKHKAGEVKKGIVDSYW